MKKLVLALALLAASAAHAATVTWTNAGGGNCLAVTSVNGQPATAGQLYCPYQSTSFATPDGGASVYVGDDILETQPYTVLRGNQIVTSYNSDGSIHTYTQTDEFTVNGDKVTATQNYIRGYATRCSKSGCHKYFYDTNIGGSGKIND